MCISVTNKIWLNVQLMCIEKMSDVKIFINIEINTRSTEKIFNGVQRDIAYLLEFSKTF
jgi:hypothetical protein